MSSPVKYVPVFRSLQEEFKVLKNFEFGKKIYPCIEIIKEIDRALPPQNERQKLISPRKEKTFEDAYLPILKEIKAQYVFVDLPVHLKVLRSMEDTTINFLTKIRSNRDERTEYIKTLKPLAKKIIPVISTYSETTGERNSIVKQEKDLRDIFNILAFRTFAQTFDRDFVQIEKVLRSSDYVIMDWRDAPLDLEDGDQTDILEKLEKLKCNIVVHRNPIPDKLANSKLKHGELIAEIDNQLLSLYKDFKGTAFSDYSGIKRGDTSGGPIISPGFLFYDAIENAFYGYRYKNGSHKKGQRKPQLWEFERTIVPAVISSEAAKRMKKKFLGADNLGWSTILNINAGNESGQNQAKFKNIGMQHYLHCMKTKIHGGGLD